MTDKPEQPPLDIKSFNEDFNRVFTEKPGRGACSSPSSRKRRKITTRDLYESEHSLRQSEIL